MRQIAFVCVACCFVGQSPQGPGQVKVEGLHNVFRITDRLYSGSGPEGDAANPDLIRAEKFGLRYVHLPIGYDGITEKQGLLLAKAVRDLPGRVYLHCQHGKHRGPAAAAVIHLCLDEKCTVPTALEEMRRAGTDPRYEDLYGAPKNFRRPSKEELDALPSNFPDVAKVTALAQHMVKIDVRWELLKLIRAADWKSPPDHPDIDPAHEALQLRDHYRDSARLPDAPKRQEEFKRWLAEAEQDAAKLETNLRDAKSTGAINAEQVEASFRKAAAACTQCHAKYRDVPQTK